MCNIRHPIWIVIQYLVTYNRLMNRQLLMLLLYHRLLNHRYSWLLLLLPHLHWLLTHLRLLSNLRLLHLHWLLVTLVIFILILYGYLLLHLSLGHLQMICVVWRIHLAFIIRALTLVICSVLTLIINIRNLTVDYWRQRLYHGGIYHRRLDLVLWCISYILVVLIQVCHLYLILSRRRKVRISILKICGCLTFWTCVFCTRRWWSFNLRPNCCHIFHIEVHPVIIILRIKLGPRTRFDCVFSFVTIFFFWTHIRTQGLVLQLLIRWLRIFTTSRFINISV